MFSSVAVRAGSVHCAVCGTRHMRGNTIAPRVTSARICAVWMGRSLAGSREW